MAETERDPWEVASMNELLALARSMEQEAIDGYVALAGRMREMGQPDLAGVFEALVTEEEGHLSKVNEWQTAIDQPKSPTEHPTEVLFDDEGAGIIAPELLSAYRAFSIAVRNEERAFVFWTYVAAHANSAEIGKAAERMAHEELGHVTRLRSERRRAFHRERRTSTKIAKTDLILLETRLADHLKTLVAAADPVNSGTLQALAKQARTRAEKLSQNPFSSTPLLEALPDTAVEQVLPLCELLTDCYIDLGQTAPDEFQRDRAQQSAAEMIHCLRAVRSWLAG